MGFSFGFEEDNVANETSLGDPLDALDPSEPARLVCVEELLNGLVGTRISFEEDDKAPGVFKRDLFDVKQQLMTEDSMTQGEEDEMFKILIGDTAEDLRKGVYEGGLKSWECSYDMIDRLKQTQVANDQPINIIEIGCGTSLPSLFLFNQHPSNAHFILCDYNYQVLRLVTLPNLLANWAATTHENEDSRQLYIDQPLIDRFLAWIHAQNIAISFISGAWSNEFLQIIHHLLPSMESQQNLVLTSETIYSPEAIPVIGEILLRLTHSDRPYTILTAKDFYFGVGGSVPQLLEFWNARGSQYRWTVDKVSSHLKRSIITLSKLKQPTTD